MRPFDVERRLERARVIVHDGPLPEGTYGLSYREGGGFVVVINQDLSRVQRRCTLYHEYFHLALFHGETFGFMDTYTETLSADKVETQVRRATARALVPRGKLYRWLAAGMPIWQIADQLDVTPEIVQDAIMFLLRG